MFELLDKIFEEFGVKFDTTKQVDSFSAIGYDGKKVIFNKNDYTRTMDYQDSEDAKTAWNRRFNRGVK